MGSVLLLADSGVLDIDENLIWAGFLNRNLLVLDWATCFLDNLSPLLLGDGGCHIDFAADICDVWRDRVRSFNA